MAWGFRVEERGEGAEGEGVEAVEVEVEACGGESGAECVELGGCGSGGGRRGLLGELRVWRRN